MSNKSNLFVNSKNLPKVRVFSLAFSHAPSREALKKNVKVAQVITRLLLEKVACNKCCTRLNKLKVALS